MVNGVIRQEKTEPVTSLNFELMLEELEGNKKLFFDIAERFFHKVKSQLILLREAVASLNTESIVFIAHSIYGGASNLRMYKLATIAYCLEKKNLVKDSSLAENEKICQEIGVELDYLVKYISELLIQHSH